MWNVWRDEKIFFEKCLEGRSIVHPIKVRVPKQNTHSIVCVVYPHTKGTLVLLLYDEKYEEKNSGLFVADFNI